MIKSFQKEFFLIELRGTTYAIRNDGWQSRNLARLLFVSGWAARYRKNSKLGCLAFNCAMWLNAAIGINASDKECSDIHEVLWDMLDPKDTKLLIDLNGISDKEISTCISPIFGELA